MNKKLTFLKFVFLTIIFNFFLFINVNAEEIPCNRWASQGATVCQSKVYDGKKCAWNSNAKGGSRCYQSDKLANSNSSVDNNNQISNDSQENNSNASQNTQNSDTEEEKKCNLWASQGATVCQSKSYQGKKCAWNGNLKGGSRCYQSDKMADTTSITSCTQITDSETCTFSKVVGYSCIWRQGACYNATYDGTDETIIAEDKEERDEIESKNSAYENLAPIKLGAISCDTIFKNNDGSYNSFYYLFQNALKIMKYLAIVLTLGLSLMDFIKVISSGDKDELKKATTRSVKRLIVGVLLFFLPTLLNFVLSIIGTYTTCNIL